MTAIAQEIEQHYSDTEKIPISLEAAETVMRAVEQTYLFSRHIWKEHHTLIFLLPATHKTEDSFCRCYQSADGRIQADIYLLVPHKDLSATPQSILLHEIGHIINLALTSTMEVQPNDFQVVSALLHLNNTSTRRAARRPDAHQARVCRLSSRPYTAQSSRA